MGTRMKNFWAKIDWPKTVSYIIVGCAGVLFYIILTNFAGVRSVFSALWSYVAPFFSGAVIAYLLNPISVFFENKLFGRMKKRFAAHALGVALTILCALLVIGLLIYAVVPQLVSSAATLVGNLDGYLAGARSWISALDAKYPFLNLDPDSIVGPWDKLVPVVTTWLQDNIKKILGTSIQVGSRFVTALISFVIAIYMMLDKAGLKRSATRLVNDLMPNRKDRFFQVARRGDQIFMRYIGYNLLDSLIIGVANFIAMVLFGMPYPLLISVIVGVTNFIPTFGPIIGAVPSAMLILIIDPLSALWFIVLCVVLQTIDANVIKPLLFGDSTGLSPLWVLVSIVVCGRMFGVLGMILGVPLFALLASLIEEALQRREAKLGIQPPPKVTRRRQKRVADKLRAVAQEHAHPAQEKSAPPDDAPKK